MGKTVVHNESARLIAWAQQQTDRTYAKDAHAIGIVDGEKIRGAMIFDSFTAANCNLHVVSDGSKRWLNKAALIAFFAYPFIQLKLRRVTGWIAAQNLEAQKFAIDIGAMREGYLPYCLPDDDIVIYGITRDRCVFIPPEFRKM